MHTRTMPSPAPEHGAALDRLHDLVEQAGVAEEMLLAGRLSPALADDLAEVLGRCLDVLARINAHAAA